MWQLGSVDLIMSYQKLLVYLFCWNVERENLNAFEFEFGCHSAVFHPHMYGIHTHMSHAPTTPQKKRKDQRKKNGS